MRSGISVVFRRGDPYELPQYNTGSYRYIERVFATPLRYLEAAIRELQSCIADTGDLVAKYQRYLAAIVSSGLQLCTIVGLLYSEDTIPLFACGADGIGHIREVLPGDSFSGSEGSLVNVAVRWLRRVTTQVERLHSKGIAGAEDRTHVLHTAHIIENDNDGMLLRRVRLSGVYAAEIVH